MSFLLLSPAGNKQSLVAAVQSGADAVYFGGELFNARANAANFTRDEMKQSVIYCHTYNVLVFVTVNILIKHKELEDVIEYAKFLSEINVDGVIVQDLGVARIFSTVAPHIALHASTQLTSTAVSDVKFLEDRGFSTVVVSRELSADEIEHICKNTSAKIEAFVHGALCMCYSGRCLMSCMLGGRSGNRGLCAQPCRLPYTLLENKKPVFEGFILSPKDLCLVNDLKKLREIGVDYLKIEGRLKRPEYVSCITGIYRSCIDSENSATSSQMTELKNAFSRGFTRGFFGKETGKTMMNHQNSSNSSENVFSEDAKKRSVENANYRKIPISIHCIGKIGKAVYMSFCDDLGNNVSLSTNEKTEYAINCPTNEDRIVSQLKKLGGTPFYCKDIDAQIDDNIRIQISELNNLRRNAVDRLIQLRTQRAAMEVFEYKAMEPIIKKQVTPTLTCEAETVEQAEACVKCGIKRMYVKQSLFDKFDHGKCEVVVKCADVTKNDFKALNYPSVLVTSVGQIYDNRNAKLYGDYSLNVTNAEALNCLNDLECVTLSQELLYSEIADICKRTTMKTEIVVYGRTTLMTIENCPIKACGRCQKHRPVYSLRDRKKEEFPLICSNNCAMKLINSKPIYLADKLEKILGCGADFLRLSFSVENSKEVVKLINDYKNAILGERIASLPENTYTRGRFYVRKGEKHE